MNSTKIVDSSGMDNIFLAKSSRFLISQEIRKGHFSAIIPVKITFKKQINKTIINIKQQQSERKSVPVWAWFSYEGDGAIHRINARLNTPQYLEVLDDVLVPTAYARFRLGPIRFVQDRSPIHTTNLVLEWFEDHPDFELIDGQLREPISTQSRFYGAKWFTKWTCNKFATRLNYGEKFLLRGEIFAIANRIGKPKQVRWLLDWK